MSPRRIEGIAMTRYLSELDRQLGVLTDHLGVLPNRRTRAEIVATARERAWDLDRLPPKEAWQIDLATLIARVRSDYAWFGRGWFEAIQVSGESGLPWAFDVIELGRLRAEVGRLLEDHVEGAALSEALTTLLCSDDVPLDEVEEQAMRLHRRAVKRRFLESLKAHALIDWRGAAVHVETRCDRRLGGESLYALRSVRFFPATGRFAVLLLDLWQDLRAPHLEENGISDALAQALVFAEETACRDLLRGVDEGFESLHPVHATIALLGPFETEVIDTDARLPPTRRLAEVDPDACFLRLAVRFAYAPSHETVGGELRQVLPHEEWRDEVIVAPSRHASKLAHALLGSGVFVLAA